MKKAIKKSILSVAVIGAMLAASTAFAGCSPDGTYNEYEIVGSLANGGFETSDLSGWTVEYGDAFDDDSVSSVTEFSFPYDADHKSIPVDQTGNWYLSGKGYDGKRPHGYTGSIRSEKFTLGGDGTISMKIAGGALVTRKGEGAPVKSPEKTCYVGVYTASNDKMIAKFTNEYFLEHTESYVNVNDYTSGTCCTDNFYRYTKNLADHVGEEMYIRIVDNDTDVYYGYISVDDIRIGGGEAQADGALYVKTRDYSKDAVAPSKYEIANGDFECGTLAGWTVVSGDAFSHDGVNSAKYWWNESITYDRDGNYHYGSYEPTATGVMRSSEFVLGGSGYISYKLGGCSNNSLAYLRFYVKSDEEDMMVAQFSNYKYWNYQFPFVQNGMRLLNLVQYYADFSEYLGKTMYIEVVDENASDDELGCVTLDSVKTYYETAPTWYDGVAFEAKVDPDLFDIEPNSPHQVLNGTFETGDLTGWEMTGDIGEVSDASGWWNENFPYNKKGKYLFTGISKEQSVGTLTSSAFTVGGTGDITFRLGGGGNPAKCYVSIIDAETEEELVRFANTEFSDNGTAGLNVNSFLANMAFYHANLIDLGIEAGRSVKIRITDNAVNNWGLITADSFITYYESEADLPENTVEAVNIKPEPEEISEYTIRNGGFESGDMTGWTVMVGGDIDGVQTGNAFWNEHIPYNNGGLFHFDGWKATPDNEPATYAIRSENFILGGSGYISFKMGGRSARVKVYKAGETPELIAEYANTEFSDKSFPHVDDGCRLATMTTYFADLGEYAGETLFIELCDAPSEVDEEGNPLNWGYAFFDDIVTYHESAPTAEMYDTVELNSATSTTGVTSFNIHWVEAVNLLDANVKRLCTSLRGNLAVDLRDTCHNITRIVAPLRAEHIVFVFRKSPTQSCSRRLRTVSNNNIIE